MSEKRHEPPPSGIRLAVMSLGWGWDWIQAHTLDKWLDEAAEAGYDGVAGFVDNEFAPFIGQPNELLKKLNARGLALGSVDMFVPCAPDHVKRVCDFLAAMDCPNLVCLGSQGKEDDDFRKLAVCLNEIGESARTRGVRSVYHNHTGFTGETFEDMERLLALTDPAKVSVMVDTGHATKDFIEHPFGQRAALFMRKYWDRLSFTEFKDWNEQTDLNTPLGEGRCGYAEVFALLKERGYQGWITVEQNGHEGLSLGRSALECAKISRDFVRQGLGL